ncbi:unnamed protein product [Paramecium sonneborni]|uniref:Uncharacterized protein n=1 Tax=Paramecium sonneborni TaxID=65129 RepID=A0A8S1RQL2_9CILI|nr:unnamed protein product [Paramecium sonneborni]
MQTQLLQYFIFPKQLYFKHRMLQSLKENFLIIKAQICDNYSNLKEVTLWKVNQNQNKRRIDYYQEYYKHYIQIFQLSDINNSCYNVIQPLLKGWKENRQFQQGKPSEERTKDSFAQSIQIYYQREIWKYRRDFIHSNKIHLLKQYICQSNILILIND